MSAIQTLNEPPRSARKPPPPAFWKTSTWPVILVALTFSTLLIQGYHPLAEDGGLYVAGIDYLLDPTLFPHYTAFVTEHLHFSLFAPTLAAIVHLTQVPLPWTLLLVNLFSIGLTLCAALKILQCCTANQPAQLAGLCLLSTFWALPIAGTSLMLMDPYVTARSLSTPLTLLAISFALDPWSNPNSAHGKSSWRSPALCTVSLLIAALFHPLMAAYGLAFILILRLTRLRRRILALTMLLVAALTLAAALQSLATTPSPAVLAADLSRYYWFLSQWLWFELLGLAGPLLVLTLLCRYYTRHPSATSQTAATLCRASIAAGLIAITIALLFARQAAPTHLVARLQPLRIFLPIYAIMALLLGATLTQLALQARRYRLLRSLPAITLLTLAAVMFAVQRQTFPASNHLELPWTTPTNPWTQAFLWARNNTPRNALFALDAKYVNEDGEDAQTFRAIALRSALPDFSKDGGEAAITTALASQWQPAALAQANLYTATDTQRDTRLLPLGVTWIVLHTSAATSHLCPYDNGTVKICRLRP